MVYPLSKEGAPPNPDMPPNVLAIYEEAREVSTLSPRSAAALLRLALQLLVDDLDTESGSINEKIGRLVSRGLDPQVQKAMDLLRIIGNNAVHPGDIQVNEASDLAASLFALLNLVVEQMITRPKHISSLFDTLPPGSRAQIARRDGTA